MPTKKLAPHFPKVKIAGIPDWWTLLYRAESMEGIPAQSELEQQRINRETEAVTDARLNILADQLSIPRGQWKALAEAIAVNYVKDFAVKATSVAARGRHAKPERFATVTMVELCMLANAVNGKEISVKQATRLLAANPELKTGQADALEVKFYKCLRELEGNPKTLQTLSLWRGFRSKLLLDPEQRAEIEADLSRTENECFPARVKK
jgi:hypothetical protein